MANKEPQIKPNGVNHRQLVDLLYMIAYSIQGICQKLDDDGGVPKTDYEANVYTAIFNGQIEDSRGNSLINMAEASGETVAEDRFFILTPMGLSEGALLECLYQIFDMMETLTEQLDADVLGDSNYEALCYTAYFLWKIENCKGSALGNGTTYYFRPGGAFNYDQLVDLLYAILYALQVLTAKLDDDGTVTDTNYEALWYTATILMRVENSKGSVAGNTPTWAP